MDLGLSDQDPCSVKVWRWKTCRKVKTERKEGERETTEPEGLDTLC